MNMNKAIPRFDNPFRPGAGHMPPYLAGRREEIEEFGQLLGQRTILENLILTGLRGVGKTVLLETFRPTAIRSGWLWVGADLSETTSISELNMATRLLTDLSVVTSSVVIGKRDQNQIGFAGRTIQDVRTLNYSSLAALYDKTPGLVSDKIKQVLEQVWIHLARQGSHGVIFAYDEAQNLANHSEKEQYPLSLTLDVFQSIQKKNIPFMLALTGLPTLFPKLVEARTFAGRMFRVVLLDRLGQADSADAIIKPIQQSGCPVVFDRASVEEIARISGGYPYFIQYICRQVYDVFVQQAGAGRKPAVPVDEIIRKLDSDFFAGRWARATDRQRDLLGVAARLDRKNLEFTVQELVKGSRKTLSKPFSSSHVNQMLVSLCDLGLVYKNRYGKYSFAVPLLDQFILRQLNCEP